MTTAKTKTEFHPRRVSLTAGFTLGFTLAVMLRTIPVRAAGSSPSPVVTAAKELIQRVIPQTASQFVFEQIPAHNGYDTFEIEGRDGKIVLRGNNAVAIAAALNWYLERKCHCDISWNAGNQLDLPARLPSVSKQVRASGTPQKKKPGRLAVL